MLINEVISKSKNFPLLESDLIKNGEKVSALNGEFEWNEIEQAFKVVEPGTIRIKKNEFVPQGTRAEYEILKSAGIIKKGGQMEPRFKKALQMRFKDVFKGPSIFTKTGDDLSTQDGKGFGAKAGAFVGSLIGQGIDKITGAPNETFPKGYSMHFISKKGEPINVSLEQPYTDKDFKRMAKKKQLIKVRAVDSNRTFGVGVDKLKPGFAQ